MVMINYIKCKTCKETIIIKVQATHSRERLKFECPNCKETLSFIVEGMDLGDFENFEFSKSKHSNFTPIYLCTKILTSEGMANSPMLPSASYAVQINSGKIKMIDENKIKKLWEILFRAFDQMNLNNTEYYNNVISEYNEIMGYSFESYEEYLFDFIMLNISDEHSNRIENVFKIIKNLDKTKLKDFTKYISIEMKSILPRLHLLMNNYYSFLDLNYIFIVAIHSNMKDKINNIYFPYKNFNEINMLYGNIFELFSDLLLVNTCINNIQNGRNYNEFEHAEKYTLKKYKENNKANRANPFKDNKDLYIFCEEFESQLRNGSHHLNTVYNKKTSKIEYSNKNKDGLEIKDYLLKSNVLYFNTISLMAIWLLLSYGYSNSSV